MKGIKGKSICETCGNEFSWRRYATQTKARFCTKKCGYIADAGRMRAFNDNKFQWSTASEAERKEKLKANFEEKVIKQDGCWDWKGYFDKDGYSQVHGHNGKRHVPLKAHRVSYEIHKGVIPKGLRVCHSCDNPRCTNPEHLWVGTAKQNSEDEVRKGRSSKGEDRHNAKLTEENVKEIRKMLDLGLIKSTIARKFGVSFMTITYIERRKTWKHVN